MAIAIGIPFLRPVVSTIGWYVGSYSSTLVSLLVRLGRPPFRLDLPKLLPLGPDPLVVASVEASAA